MILLFWFEIEIIDFFLVVREEYCFEDIYKYVCVLDCLVIFGKIYVVRVFSGDKMDF